MLGLLRQFAVDSSCTDISSSQDTLTTTKNTTDTYCTNLPTSPASSDNLQIIVHILFGTMAVIVVLVIVIAALNIVTANGDSGKVAKARSNILYALVGLTVAVSADIIVSLIIARIRL